MYSFTMVCTEKESLVFLSFVVAAETVVTFEIVADREFLRAERLSAAGTAGFLLLVVVC
jgi:hypothetical protein